MTLVVPRKPQDAGEPPNRERARAVVALSNLCGLAAMTLSLWLALAAAQEFATSGYRVGWFVLAELMFVAAVAGIGWATLWGRNSRRTFILAALGVSLTALGVVGGLAPGLVRPSWVVLAGAAALAAGLLGARVIDGSPRALLYGAAVGLATSIVELVLLRVS